MPQGKLSIRIDDNNETHHIWFNNGTWWVHYTLNFDFRTRRIRRPLNTKSRDEAIRLRDALFARLSTEGEWVPERGEQSRMPVPRVLPRRVSVIRKLGNVIRRFAPLGC
jgi:hypothetical protein